MARKQRVEYPRAIYHIINRGDRRETQKFCAQRSAGFTDSRNSFSTFAYTASSILIRLHKR